MFEGRLVYDISDVDQVPSIGHQLDLREEGIMGLLQGLYTVKGVTWDLSARSAELDVERSEEAE
jgi:hypothetical protein